MKRQNLIIALVLLLLPILARILWFYPGFPPARTEIATPDFASFTRPQAAVSTPDLDNIQQLGGTVLVDGYHGNQFTLNEIDSLTSAFQARGGKTEVVLDAVSLETQLKSASAFVSVSPSVTFTAYEAQLLKGFTERGGKILVFADATRFALYYDYVSGNPIAYGDSVAANSLLNFFDITINNDYLYNTAKNEGNFRNVLFDEFGKNELTFGLGEVALYGARSVESTSGLILLQGAETNLSSLDDAHDPNAGGAALSADGNVAVFGDFTFLSSPYSTYTDNATLIQNLADFALSGKQVASLELFPYIYSNDTVQVYIAQDLTKTSTIVTALGNLQATLHSLNLTAEFMDKAPSSGDTLIIGSFDTAEELDAYLKKADVEINSDTIDTLAFGQIVRSGNGIILFEAGKKGNTLVLLADTEDDIVALMGILNSGTLSSCLTSANVAVCSVGYSDTSSIDSGTETSTESSTESGTDATPEASPTPSG